VEEEGSAAEQSNLFQNLRCAKIHQNGKQRARQCSQFIAQMAEPQSRNNCDRITPRKSKESGGRDSGKQEILQGGETRRRELQNFA
jgi:hypothetical protein